MTEDRALINKTLEVAPSEISLDEVDALRIENSHLKSRLASDAMERARVGFAEAMQKQATMTAEMSNKYGHDLTRYDFDPQHQRLVLRHPKLVSMPESMPPPDAK